MTNQETSAWRCTVCGYIHRGEQPPDFCPVCGAEREAFEPFDEPAVTQVKLPQRWQCLNCTYIHQESTPPEVCPVCGASPDRFEALADDTRIPGVGDDRGTIVIVGAGIAGVSAAESVRKTLPNANIVLISKEDRLPYYRLNLTRFLAGEIGPESLPIHPDSWYVDHHIDVIAGEDVTRLDLDRRRAKLRSGKELPYDRLVMTMGAHPFVPPLPGINRQGVHTLRTVQDAQALLDEASSGNPCVCIGGGVLGIETAGAIARQGGNITLLEAHTWLMPRQLDQEAGELLAEHLEGMGIKLMYGARTQEIVGDERVGGVALADGTVIPAEQVIFATGVRPNSYLARLSGLDVNRGVVVNNRMETTGPGVFAAGDVAEHHGDLYGIWIASQFQGSISGLNAAGVPTDFGGIPRSNSLKVLGVDLLSVGKFQPEDGSYLVLTHREDQRYYRFVFRDGLLVGSILFGDSSFGTTVQKAVEGHTDFSGLLAKNPGGKDLVGHFTG